MTDSELLAYARDYTDKAIRNDDWLKFDLARFVASMLDDGPVNHSDAMNLGFNDGGYYHASADLLLDNDEDAGKWTASRINDAGQIEVVCRGKTLGQLRCLLRGLVVTT